MFKLPRQVSGKPVLIEFEALPSIGLHMGPNNICYVTRHFLFSPCVTMSLFIRP